MLPPYPLSWALTCVSRPMLDPTPPALSSLFSARYVVFGRPLVFLFPVAVHLTATSNILSVGIFRTWTRSTSRLRGQPFDFWERLWVISEKKYPADWFWLKKKKFCKEITSEKNILHWKKISRMAYNAGKKSYTVECWFLFPEFWGKNSLPKPNHTYTPSKVKRTTP